MTGPAFNNQIVGGQGTLIIPAIHSPNFVHNTAGWSINKDGSAEFNNAVIRGQLIVGNPATGPSLQEGAAIPTEINAYYLGPGGLASITQFTILFSPAPGSFYYMIVGEFAPLGGITDRLCATGWLIQGTPVRPVQEEKRYVWGGTDSTQLYFHQLQPNGSNNQTHWGSFINNMVGIPDFFIMANTVVNIGTTVTGDLGSVNIGVPVKFTTTGTVEFAGPVTLDATAPLVVKGTTDHQAAVTFDASAPLTINGAATFFSTAEFHQPVTFDAASNPQVSATVDLLSGSSIHLHAGSDLEVDNTANFNGSSQVVFANTVTLAQLVASEVTITPSAANTPTSTTVSYTALKGAGAVIGQTTASTTVPGTAVTGTALTAQTSTSSSVWVTRTNTTATAVFYTVWRNA